MRTTYQFRAISNEPNDEAPCGIYYHVGTAAGRQRTIGGQIVDMGGAVVHAWGGIRGMGELPATEARAAVAALNSGWSIDGDMESGVALNDAGEIIGQYVDTHKRQPGDNYMAARTIRAESGCCVEWFSRLEFAHSWLLANAALALVPA